MDNKITQDALRTYLILKFGSLDNCILKWILDDVKLTKEEIAIVSHQILVNPADMTSSLITNKLDATKEPGND